MNELNGIINDYLNKCEVIFDKKRSVLSNIIPLQKEQIDTEITTKTKTIFNQAIKEAEDTDEFDRFVNFLKDYQLFKRNHIKTIRIAADRFFKNTGTYYSVWIKKEIDNNLLINIFNDSIQKEDFEVIYIFVFDGFTLYDTISNREELREVPLPVGKIMILQKEEIESLFKIPQSEWNDKIINLLDHYVLKITRNEKYRKPTGLIAGNDFYPLPFIEWKRREDDIDLVGPLFLCLGEDANLAEEIIIRTCIFDSDPISYLDRNDYLPPDVLNEEGEFLPRRYVKYIGQDGIMLANIYRMWNEVNQLHKDGYLRFSTENYVRSIMNLHARVDSSMEIFVSFVTVMDSLLTRGERSDLTYKIASRGAAILSPISKERVRLMSYLKKIYGIRSDIVHEGHTKGKNLDSIFAELPEIIRYIFIKIIVIAYLMKNKLYDSQIMEYISNINNINKSIPEILDLSVMEPEVTKIIDKKLSEFNIELKALRIRS